MKQDFPLGRYPANIIMNTYQKADKTKQVFLLKNIAYNFEIEIEKSDGIEETFLLEVLSQVEDFDNTVQKFCMNNYQPERQNANNYKVGISWISIEEDRVEIGYWGEYVNIELRAVFAKKNGNWETIDIYYQ